MQDARRDLRGFPLALLPLLPPEDELEDGALGTLTAPLLDFLTPLLLLLLFFCFSP